MIFYLKKSYIYIDMSIINKNEIISVIERCENCGIKTDDFHRFDTLSGYDILCTKCYEQKTNAKKSFEEFERQMKNKQLSKDIEEGNVITRAFERKKEEQPRKPKISKERQIMIKEEKERDEHIKKEEQERMQIEYRKRINKEIREQKPKN